MIETPDSPELQELCRILAGVPDDDQWPGEALDQCANSGFYRWFAPLHLGGLEWSSTDIAKGYLALSQANLTVTFILTQRVAALRRIAGCENESLKQRMIAPILRGEIAATVGISHLTTSRQHLRKPMLSVSEKDGEFVANGMSPWVTGGAEADYILMGGSLVDSNDEADGRQMLFLVDSKDPCVVVKKGFELVALSASHTGTVDVNHIAVPRANVVAGPVEDVLAGNGGGAGGLQTSVLAIGLAKAAIEFIETESKRRADLVSAHELLQCELTRLQLQLLLATDGDTALSAAEIRTQANSLVLRATQSAMVAAKGAGYVHGHPVGRWCREALFFLVWSCPDAVSKANLDEFAICGPGSIM